MNQDLSRRRFLRGLGTLIALPAMESIVPVKAFAAPVKSGLGSQFPLRMAFIYSPNGRNMAQWTPAKTGTDYELSPSLKPLESVKSSIQVLTGLKHDKAAANGDGGGDHARANATFLTGMQARKTAGADIRAGISVDQIAANSIGQLTKLPSLELSCDEARRAGNCDSGYSCAYQFNLAWKNESMPISPERDPKLAFERLFSNGLAGEADAARAKREFYNKSILDFVNEDARTLQKHLGSTDKRKLDEYMTSIRDIERRLTQANKEAKDMPAYDKPTGIPGSYEQHIRIMFDLMALAFQTDTTRISTFLLAHDGSNRTFPDIGVKDQHHGISHHQRDPQKLEMIAKIDEYYCRQYAYFIEKLKGIKEGNGSLLDNCMIVYGGGISDPDAHSHRDLPVILAGGGGGTLKTGRHVRVNNEPMCNLFLSMLDRAGVKEPRFGDSTGRLDVIG
ncbi:MAG TPA: DUF1552 domain-containing protein [Verrucomicrobiales bacterium]|jgi:hypothetical protein|nr:DUF1552 domain-containing protein [Verrucomicrobiales bacterium]